MATANSRRSRTFGQLRWPAATLHRILLLLAMGYLLAPFCWMVLTAVLPAEDLSRPNPRVDLGAISLSSFGELLTDPSFLKPMGNSAIIALATMVLCVALGAPAAYALSRFRIRGRDTVLLGLLATQMVPVIALAVPLFMLMRGLGLLDTHFGLIATYTAFILPIVIWMLVGFFDEVPGSLERAARIDGCNRIQAMTRIVLPLASSGIAAAAIFAFITAWSDFFLALVLTSDAASTLPVRVAQFQSLFALDYRAAATAGVITTLPVLLLALVFQRWIIRGLTEGAVKG